MATCNRSFYDSMKLRRHVHYSHGPKDKAFAVCCGDAAAHVWPRDGAKETLYFHCALNLASSELLVFFLLICSSPTVQEQKLQLDLQEAQTIEDAFNEPWKGCSVQVRLQYNSLVSMTTRPGGGKITPQPFLTLLLLLFFNLSVPRCSKAECTAKFHTHNQRKAHKKKHAGG